MWHSTNSNFLTKYVINNLLLRSVWNCTLDWAFWRITWKDTWRKSDSNAVSVVKVLFQTGDWSTTLVITPMRRNSNVSIVRRNLSNYHLIWRNTWRSTLVNSPSSANGTENLINTRFPCNNTFVFCFIPFGVWWPRNATSLRENVWFVQLYL